MTQRDITGLGDKVRESRLRRFGYVRRRDSEFILVDAQDGATRQEAKRKIKEEIHGCVRKLV